MDPAIMQSKIDLRVKLSPLGCKQKSESRNVSRIADVPLEQPASEIVLHRPPRRSGEAKKGFAPTVTDEVLPLEDVGVRSGVESAGVRHTDVEIVPGITFDQETRDISHARHVDTVRAPVLVFGSPEIPCDAPHRHKMIPSAGLVPIRLILHPLQYHLAVPITILGTIIRPQVFPNGESGVKRNIKRGRRIRFHGTTLVV
ncbi:hypothetical protein GQ457_06G038890 [Hibiscus cannabinus]